MFLKISSFITGDDYKHLENETPASKKKVSLMAITVLVPVLVWFFTSVLMVKQVMNYSAGVAILTGFVTAVIIFVIEKSIIMSSGSKRIAVFRICLGFIVALLGAVCLDEVIFKDDISRQMDRNKTKEASAAAQNIDEEYKGRVDKAEADVAAKNHVWLTALNDVNREADGSGGSGKKGVHAITKLKQQTAVEKENDYKAAKAELATLRSEIELKKANASAAIESASDERTFLHRIIAMFDLVLSNGWAAAAYMLITLFFFLLEFLVVILKYCMDETNYERKVKLIEEIGKRRMEELRKSQALLDPAFYHPGAEKTRELLKRSSNTLYN